MSEMPGREIADGAAIADIPSSQKANAPARFCYWIFSLRVGRRRQDIHLFCTFVTARAANTRMTFRSIHYQRQRNRNTHYDRRQK